MPFFLVPPINRGGDGEPSPSSDHERPDEIARLGMWILILSLSVFFIATLVALGLLRFKFADWDSSRFPHIPAGVYYSTLLLLLSGICMYWAQRAARNSPGTLALAMALTTLLGCGFLGIQALNWQTLARAFEYQVELKSFYVLTGLHALHVLVGVFSLVLVTIGAFAGRYSPQSHRSVTVCAMYWHFLEIVWLVLLLIFVLAI